MKITQAPARGQQLDCQRRDEHHIIMYQVYILSGFESYQSATQQLLLIKSVKALQ